MDRPRSPLAPRRNLALDALAFWGLSMLVATYLAATLLGAAFILDVCL